MEDKEVVKIRLKKFGTKKRPYYRIVVQDVRKPRDGATVEEIGFYHPIDTEDKQISFKEDRAKYWLSVGAQPTPIVKKLFNTKGLSVKGESLNK
jgi:small subunit ribosomal protein S16